VKRPAAFGGQRGGDSVGIVGCQHDGRDERVIVAPTRA